MIRFVLLAALVLATSPASARAGDKIISSAFEIASKEYALQHDVPVSLLPKTTGTTVVRLEETPTSRWNSEWGSYPAFVSDVLSMLGDENVEYLGQGQVRVSYGPRKVLIDTLQRLHIELERRGLRLTLQVLSRDESINRRSHGDTNSDHMIGLAADGRITVAPCLKGGTCPEQKKLAANPLEVQLRIIAAAATAGVQQINMYGNFRRSTGQWTHIGVSPFRNGAVGELLGSARADSTRRIGYGSAQKGDVGTLSLKAKQYVGFDGTLMSVAFEKLLHNAPPVGYEGIYNAIRDRNFEWIEDVMD